MRESVFRFKQFAVTNKESAMKVGTDGVLIGAWADCGIGGRILDAGCGTGLIALMLAQRNQPAQITAIDIDSTACAEARYNVAASPWSERIEVHQTDILDYCRSGAKFDAVVSNPPFYANGLLCPDGKRSIARHAVGLPLDAFMESCSALLADDGVLSFIYPTEYLDDIVVAAGNVGLSVTRLCRVLPRADLPSKRVLVQCRRCPVEMKEETLVIEIDRNVYTEAYKALTRDFYLRF